MGKRAKADLTSQKTAAGRVSPQGRQTDMREVLMRQEPRNETPTRRTLTLSPKGGGPSESVGETVRVLGKQKEPST